MTKIFIGGFPLDMDELALVELIAPFADVVTIKLVRHRDTKICKGYGFIEVVDEVAAQNAVYQLNRSIVGDRELSLNIVQENPVRAAPLYRKSERHAAVDRIKRPRRPRI
ncbi:RNA recognition motif. (a.k.a. RRM, RBD, or RNP domain) [Mucilaginibacter pineti]|uniref:RNA recognition motif. (A.k.a. RRM, RBD, or RNP domain) n=1 Tax=Mucilaginibacter pineti TaxID=1391627 RepID=A0A1G7JUG9_9SPHI|nr:RNA-binding protein [Mucilaginibacter pineti]SDF28515.1 RNA recognition motif. (a.k.a. RRM, RBD, or RNP domain) [Mucilaginibacter pineti]